jgi:hypothetical protein
MPGWFGDCLLLLLLLLLVMVVVVAEKTFDYGDRDDDSAGSYAVRLRREKERRAREAVAATVAKESGSGVEAEAEVEDPAESPLINKDDVEHYTGSLDNPMTKVGMGVLRAVTIGCMVMGPIGLLVGAAAVGLGVGVLQIPRKKIAKRYNPKLKRSLMKSTTKHWKLPRACRPVVGRRTTTPVWRSICLNVRQDTTQLSRLMLRRRVRKRFGEHPARRLLRSV